MGARVTAFFEDRVIARGERDAVTRAVEQGWPNDQGRVRAFDDSSGQPVDLDLYDAAKAAMRARGRPRLGVVAREVTLLPRHWEWLSKRSGGASAELRRLVEEARQREAAGAPDPRAARDSVYRFVTEMAGDRPGYEEAIRALYRGEDERFAALVAEWPEDVRNYAVSLLKRGGGSADSDEASTAG